jgi:cell division inhibitor SepF
MASMWRRAMVYLGLQDDDELDYGGDYEPYGDYGDHHLDDSREGADGEPGDAREPARRQPVPAAPVGRDVPPDYAAPAPPPRPSGRENPSGVSMTRPAVVRTIGPATAARVHVVVPSSFNDVQEVGDRLKANQPVILNLQGIAAELRRRLVDFSSGLAYATGGTMARVADRVYLLTPSNVEISQEEKERLQARGLFQT